MINSTETIPQYLRVFDTPGSGNLFSPRNRGGKFPRKFDVTRHLVGEPSAGGCECDDSHFGNNKGRKDFQ